ncbi:hypothetical protein [Pseudomonas sp. NA-150]|uniref:hypothetical protein n=1 Tax=Pseudomonas sp. NA-150 TaxID=3367525 RepID=UPI0037C7A200
MDPLIQEGAQRQSELEAAKAAFLLSGGSILLIATGVGQGNSSALTKQESFAQRKGSKKGRDNQSADLKRKRELLAQSVRYCIEVQGMTVTDTAAAVGINATMVATVKKEFGISKPCAA